MIEWIKKFLGGFNFTSPAVWGKWIFYAILFSIFMFAWSTMTGKKTATTNNQRAEKITNPSIAPQQTFGCMRLDIRGDK